MNIWKRKNDDAKRLHERSRSQPIFKSQGSENEEERGNTPQANVPHTSFSLCCEKFSRISPIAMNDPERGGVTWVRDASVNTCGGCNCPFTVLNRRVSITLNTPFS